MRTPRHAVAEIIANKTLKSGVGRSYSRTIAAFLLSEGRTGELNSLLRDVQTDWANKGAISVVAVSARQLNDNNRREIKSEVRKLYPPAKHITITTEIDPNLIGGIQLRFADQILDLSIISKLNKFKRLTAAGVE